MGEPTMDNLKQRAEEMVGRLRGEAVTLYGTSIDRGTPDASLSGLLADAAADLIAALVEEMERLTSSGIVEVAVRNLSVMEYMKHWEDRAEALAAENERLRGAIDDVVSGRGMFGGNIKEDFAWTMRVLEAALTEKEKK